MKVLLLGATGNLGSRLIPALLTHNHTVVVFVRSSSKLQALLPPTIFEQITIVEGDAKDSQQVQRAIVDAKCGAVVTAAGVAALAPWAHSDLPKIFRSVLEAVKQAGVERKQPLRTWFLGGQGVLNYPGTKSQLADYIPIFLEHRANLALLRALPPNTVDWSMLCPQTMIPESSELNVPTRTSSTKLVAAANLPPKWNNSWIRHLPLIGKVIVRAMNASRYQTTLEQNAEFIAADLEEGSSKWVGCAVGVVDAAM